MKASEITLLLIFFKELILHLCSIFRRTHAHPSLSDLRPLKLSSLAPFLLSSFISVDVPSPFALVPDEFLPFLITTKHVLALLSLFSVAMREGVKRRDRRHLRWMG